MKRSLLAINILLVLACAAFVAVTVLGAVYRLFFLSIFGAVMVLIMLWIMAGSIYCERTYEKFNALFAKRDFAAALTVLDKASENHFLFPILRTTVYLLYIKGELAVDNLSQAAKYVEILRHHGGDLWKYRTAFFVVLFNLDWGDFAAARDEFLSFENACAHSHVYKEELEILRSLFALIAGKGESLPDSVKNSPYPAVHRIVGRH